MEISGVKRQDTEMKCPECGCEIICQDGPFISTCIAHHPYWVKGVYHNENPNTFTIRYCCQNGHTWKWRYKDGRIISDSRTIEEVKT